MEIKEYTFEEIKKMGGFDIPESELNCRNEIKVAAQSYQMLANVILGSSQKELVSYRKSMSEKVLNAGNVILALLEKYEDEYLLNEILTKENTILREKIIELENKLNNKGE